MRVVMLGAPGVGKGTQATFLAQRLGVPQIASGDLFRRHRRGGTELGRTAQEYMDQGLLVPDEITTSMVLEEAFSPASRWGFVLDGYPRNLRQAKSLDQALADRGMKVDRAILIEVSRDELVARLAKRLICGQCQAIYHAEANPPRTPGICDRCGFRLEHRIDDDPAAIDRRFEVYQEQTLPLVEFYQIAGKLLDIDGLGTVEEVRRRVEEQMDRAVTPRSG